MLLRFRNILVTGEPGPPPGPALRMRRSGAGGAEVTEVRFRVHVPPYRSNKLTGIALKQLGWGIHRRNEVWLEAISLVRAVPE